MLVPCESPSYVVPPASPPTHLHSSQLHINKHQRIESPVKCRPKTILPISLLCLRFRLRLLISSLKSQLKSPLPSPKRASRNTSPRLQSNRLRRLRRRLESDHPHHLTNMCWQITLILQYVTNIDGLVFSLFVHKRLARVATFATRLRRVQGVLSKC